MTTPPPERFAAARARFEELVELDCGERATRLAELSAADSELAEAVAALLAADAQADSGEFLGRPVGGVAPTLVEGWLAGDAEAAVGALVGPWRLLAPLGRGGMGEVWEAERADGGFEQRVALKLVKRGMDSEEILGRFLRERQILAHLAHPGIARLLDGGLTADGRPFFALEKVSGAPITQHARERGLAVAARVDLMIAACDAVDSAHRQLVVHRDLKPSNVMVTDEGEVKLLDFGIAKLLGEPEGEAPPTALGLRALTPAYAAPEQILGEPVTTATDVYSLGVLLFELLTSQLPHRRSASTPAGLAVEVARETAPRVTAAARRLGGEEMVRLGLPARELRQLERRLAGDLETILGRALHRDPARRYTSAAALADDLRRYRGGRPVRARPDSRLYRSRKFVARHRVAVASAALVVLSLVGGLSVALWQARRAAAAALAADANAHRAERVKEFLIGLFEVADPEQSGGGVTARELIEQASQRLEVELQGETAIRADLLEAVARIDRSLGLLEPAARAAERALTLRLASLPEDHPAVAGARATLGAVRLYEGRLDESAVALAAAVAVLERSERADSLGLARVRSDYANLRFWQGHVAESEALERLVYETYRAALGPDHLQTAIHQRNLGVLLDALGRLDEAEAACRASLAVIERALGPEHVNSAQSYLNLAGLVEQRGRFEEAERLYRRALEIRRAKLGSAHATTGQSLQLFALFLLNRGRLDESERVYREALALFAAINPRHFEVGKCSNGLALIAGRRGDHAEAERLLRDVVALFREQLGDEHPFVWMSTLNLAREIAAQRRWSDAEALQREAAARLAAISGAADSETRRAFAGLAESLRAQGRTAEADAVAARAAPPAPAAAPAAEPGAGDRDP